MKNFHTFQFFRKENCLISTAGSIAKMGWLFLIWSRSLLLRGRPSDLCAELIGQSIYLKQWSKLCFILYSYTVTVLHYVLTPPHKMKSFTSEWCLPGQCWLCAKEGTLFSISNVLACPWTIVYFASVIHWLSNPVHLAFFCEGYVECRSARWVSSRPQRLRLWRWKCSFQLGVSCATTPLSSLSSPVCAHAVTSF